jgi:hypothetical protein
MAVEAVALDAPTLMPLIVVLITRPPRVLLYLPEYTLFSVPRSDYTLECMLSVFLGHPKLVPIPIDVKPL